MRNHRQFCVMCAALACLGRTPGLLLTHTYGRQSAWSVHFQQLTLPVYRGPAG
jgi:hypothetical protein